MHQLKNEIKETRRIINLIKKWEHLELDDLKVTLKKYDELKKIRGSLKKLTHLHVSDSHVQSLKSKLKTIDKFLEKKSLRKLELDTEKLEKNIGRVNTLVKKHKNTLPEDAKIISLFKKIHAFLDSVKTKIHSMKIKMYHDTFNKEDFDAVIKDVEILEDVEQKLLHEALPEIDVLIELLEEEKQELEPEEDKSVNETFIKGRRFHFFISKRAKRNFFKNEHENIKLLRKDLPKIVDYKKQNPDISNS